MAFNAETIVGPPTQRKYNGEYAFPFTAIDASETEAGSIIIRKNLIGMSQRNVDIGNESTAELQGTMTVAKAVATEFDQGDVVFWDKTNRLAVKTGTLRLGICKMEHGEDAETVEVLINLMPCVETP